MAHHSHDAATGFAAVATRARAGCWSMEDRRRKSLINWPYQPKHSPSLNNTTENNISINKINVNKIQPEYWEYHFVQIQ